MINEKIFHEDHETTINRLKEICRPPKISSHDWIIAAKIFYVFFLTENGECGIEPFIKDEENKCFIPIHDDFLMSGERFIFTILTHKYVEDVTLQDLINDDELLPEDVARALMSERDKKDAEFIEFLSERWCDNDISKCL